MMSRHVRSWALTLMLPAIIVISVGILFPTVEGIVTSFRVMTLTRPALDGWAGLDNYRRLVADPDFWQSLKNTVTWVICSITLEFVLGLSAALLLNRRLPGSGLLMLLIVFPYFMPNVVVAHMWALMLDSRLGLINDVFVRLGLFSSGKAWLADPFWAMACAIIAQAWHGYPFFAIVILAGLNTIPRELTDHAILEGTGPFARIRYITLPMLKTLIFSAVVLRAISLMNSPELILVLTGGGPAKSTLVLSLQTFNLAFRDFDFGYAGSTSVVMLTLLVGLTALYVRLMNIGKA